MASIRPNLQQEVNFLDSAIKMSFIGEDDSKMIPENFFFNPEFPNLGSLNGDEHETHPDYFRGFAHPFSMVGSNQSISSMSQGGMAHTVKEDNFYLRLTSDGRRSMNNSVMNIPGSMSCSIHKMEKVLECDSDAEVSDVSSTEIKDLVRPHKKPKAPKLLELSRIVPKLPKFYEVGETESAKPFKETITLQLKPTAKLVYDRILFSQIPLSKKDILKSIFEDLGDKGQGKGRDRIKRATNGLLDALVGSGVLLKQKSTPGGNSTFVATNPLNSEMSSKVSKLRAEVKSLKSQVNEKQQQLETLQMNYQLLERKIQANKKHARLVVGIWDRNRVFPVERTWQEKIPLTAVVVSYPKTKVIISTSQLNNNKYKLKVESDKDLKSKVIRIWELYCTGVQEEFASLDVLLHGDLSQMNRLEL